MNLDHQGAAITIDHGVTFAAFRFLAGVVATRAAGLDGFDSLTVDHRGRRTGLSADPLPVEHDKMVIDGLEQPLAAEPQEPTLDRRHRRKVLRQHAPGAAGPRHLEEISRIGHSRGRPVLAGGGMKGAMISHSASLRSLP